jgi:hypothetical protein
LILGLRAAIAAVMLALLLMGYISYYWPITEPFYPLNNGWNGCSQAYKMAAHPSLIYSYSAPLPTDASLILIIGPRSSFQTGETVKLRTFLEAGGTVLLADDLGTGNALLEGLNVSARFSEKPIADLYFYSRSPSFPLISHFTPGWLSTNLTTIIMDHPSYIEVLNSQSVGVVAFSSSFSFVDSFNNGTLPPTENTQPYPVIATTHVGRGLLVMVANAYVFANEIMNLFDNRALFRNLLSAANGTVTFDLAHLTKAPLTDQRIMFRSGFDSSVVFMHTLVVQLAVTAMLVAVFSTIFLRRVRAEKHHADSSVAESSLHTNSM